MTRNFAKASLWAASLAACGGPLSVPSPSAVGSAVVKRADYTYKTVDDPNSTTNEVTAINAHGGIVGTIGSGTSSDPFEGYTAKSPYSSFSPVNYESAGGTVATAQSSVLGSAVVGGYVINPPQLPGIWGFVRIGGIWTILRDPKGEKGASGATELLSVNSSEFAVGFYLTTTGSKLPFMLDVPLERYTGLRPPGSSSAVATGINNTSSITGWETTQSGVTGFLLRAGVYYSLSAPSAVKTEAFGINDNEQVVGFFQTSGGGKHGFVLSNPQASQDWQQIDDPNAAYGTWVTGINDAGDICGYYIDASGVQHGFVASPGK